jgi:hypothetical protein
LKKRKGKGEYLISSTLSDGGLPRISDPVSMREPGRFELKAIWPSAAPRA